MKNATKIRIRERNGKAARQAGAAKEAGSL